jgi:hypothetical protein
MSVSQATIIAAGELGCEQELEAGRPGVMSTVMQQITVMMRILACDGELLHGI